MYFAPGGEGAVGVQELEVRRVAVHLALPGDGGALLHPEGGGGDDGVRRSGISIGPGRAVGTAGGVGGLATATVGLGRTLLPLVVGPFLGGPTGVAQGAGIGQGDGVGALMGIAAPCLLALLSAGGEAGPHHSGGEQSCGAAEAA